MKTLFTITFALLLAGCAATPAAVQNAGVIVTTEYAADGKPIKTVEQRTDYGAYLKTFETQTVNAKLVEVDCTGAPTTNCFTGKLTVYQPGGGNDKAHPQAPAVPEDTGWKIWREVKEMALGIAPWGFGSSVLKAAFKAASPTVNTTTLTNTTNSTSVSASGSGASAAAGGSASGSYSAPTTTNTTTTTTTTTNSNNRTATGGNTTTGAGGPANNGP